MSEMTSTRYRGHRRHGRSPGVVERLDFLCRNAESAAHGSIDVATARRCARRRQVANSRRRWIAGTISWRAVGFSASAVLVRTALPPTGSKAWRPCRSPDRHRSEHALEFAVLPASGPLPHHTGKALQRDQSLAFVDPFRLLLDADVIRVANSARGIFTICGACARS